MSSHRYLCLFALVLFAACGSSEEAEPAPAATVSTEAEELDPGPVGAYEVHEWGLVDVVMADGSFEIAAGPGDPVAPTSGQPSAVENVPTSPPSMDVGGMHPVTMHPVTMGTPSPQAGRRKPVLYFHLASETPVTFSTEVSLAGSIAEHWPPAELGEHTVSWSEVTARPGACTSGTYPTRDSAECANAPGGYCELADLQGYETSDGACLTFEGQTWDHLFYRGTGSGVTLPITITRDGDELQVTNDALAAPVGALYYLNRGAVGSASPVTAAKLGVPAVGESAAFAAPGSGQVADVRTELSALLRSGGLTEPEAAAFEAAWFSELFANGPTGGAPLVRESVIFVMPESLLEPISRLSFEPAPTAVRRVMWIRVDVTPSN